MVVIIKKKTKNDKAKLSGSSASNIGFAFVLFSTAEIPIKVAENVIYTKKR
jgi:hypothetical protein